MKILFVLGARSEFGYVVPVYREAERRGHEVAIWSCNTASLAGFGDIARKARESGLNVRQIATTAFDGYTRVAMAKSVGAVTQSFADFLGTEDFDWVVLAGDRAEQLGAAIASSYTYVPTAHIQAGERSGNIDGLARHAIARLVHLHLAANTDAQERLLRSGEEDWRVIMSGAPQLDGFVDSAASMDELIKRRLVPRSEFILAVFHPDTARSDYGVEDLRKLISVLRRGSSPVVWIAPNNDAGALEVRDIVLGGLRAQDLFHENVSRSEYAGILKHCRFLVGNSSSGLIEAPSFLKVAVNIGRRQDGRFRGSNVIDVEVDPTAIEQAFADAERVHQELNRSGVEHPYGDGRSSSVIVEALEELRRHPDLLRKQLTF